MKFTRRLKNAFLDVFGDMKFFPIPPVIVYAPETFRVKGRDARMAMGLIKKGDLVMRKYYGYLDGYFIPGKYSHTGVYIGDGKVIHAVAEGVCEEDLIDFMRCDRFIILRPRFGQEAAVDKCMSFLGKPYDFDFSSGNKALYCHEVAAEAYNRCGIEKKIPRLFKGLLQGKKTYLAESFLTNENFEVVYEFKE